MLIAEGGSFKDPAGRVYRVSEVRAMPTASYAAWTTPPRPPWRDCCPRPSSSVLTEDGDVAETKLLSPEDPAARLVDRTWLDQGG